MSTSMVLRFRNLGVSLRISEYSIGEAPLGLTRLKAASETDAKAQAKLIMVEYFMMSRSACRTLCHYLVESRHQRIHNNGKGIGGLTLIEGNVE